MNITDILFAKSLSGGGGGGGDSDFSTAKLTIVNTSEDDGLTLDNYFGFPFIDDNSVQCYPTDTLAPLQSIEFNIVLYKGTAIGGAFGSGFTFSGNISEDDGVLTITGDCTITFTPEI